MTYIASFLATLIRIFMFTLMIKGILSFIPKNPNNKNSFRNIIDSITNWYLKIFIKENKSLLKTNFSYILSFIPLIIVRTILIYYSWSLKLSFKKILYIVISTFWFNLFLWILVFFIIILSVYIYKGYSNMFGNLVEKILQKTYLSFYKNKTASDKKLAITALILFIILAIGLTILVFYLEKILI